MTKKLTITILLFSLLFNYQNTKAQVIVGLYKNGISKYDLNKKKFSAYFPSAWKTNGMAAGFATTDQKNSRYFSVEPGVNGQPDTLRTYNILNGNLISKDTIPNHVVFRNPEFCNDTLFGFDQTKGFGCYILSLKKYQLLNKQAVYSQSFQGAQMFDAKRRKYISLSFGFNTDPDTVISISIDEPYTIQKDTFTIEFIQGAVYSDNCIYGLMTSGFHKLDLSSRQLTVFLAPSPIDGYFKFPATIDPVNHLYIYSRRAKGNLKHDSLFCISMLDGHMVFRDSIPEGALYNIKAYYEGVNTGIVNALIETAKIYPNPARHIFNIEWSGPSLKTIHLYNMMGALVKTIATEEQTIDVENVPPGLYIVSIRSGAISYSAKLMIE